MYEYEARNIKTNEKIIVLGYGFKEACEHFGYDYKEYRVIGEWYVD